MDPSPIVFIFCCQLWWNPLLADRKRPTVSSSPPEVLNHTTRIVSHGPTSVTYSIQSTGGGHPAKNERQSSTAKPLVLEPEDPQKRDDHFIAAVLIGVILVVMILIIVSIFLWKRWRKVVPSAPHWAGQSPFADGDVLDDTTEKEPTLNPKRMSVLSILPWKFNKDAQLLENAEGHSCESTTNQDAMPTCSTEETEKQLSPAAISKSAFSTSIQTPSSEDPGNLIDVPLHQDSPRAPDLSPPPNWIHGVNEKLCPNQYSPKAANLSPPPNLIHGGNQDPCPNHRESPSPGQNVVIPCSIPPPTANENAADVFLFPPPPEDLLST